MTSLLTGIKNKPDFVPVGDCSNPPTCQNEGFVKQSDGVCSCQCVDGLTGPDCTELDTSPGGSSVFVRCSFLGFVIETTFWFYPADLFKPDYLNRMKMDSPLEIRTLQAMNLN